MSKKWIKLATVENTDFERMKVNYKMQIGSR